MEEVINMVRKSQIKLFYENMDITREVVRDILSLNTTDNLGSVDDISISIADKDRKWMNKWQPQKGDAIKIELSGENWDEVGDLKKINLGPFSVDRLSHSGTPQIVSISGVSYGLSGSIKENIKNKVWENIDLKTIAMEVCKGAGIELFMDSDYIPKYSRIEQNEETDLSLLKRLCDKDSLVLKCEVGKIIIFDERKYEGNKSILEIKHSNSLSYNIETNDLETYDSCEVSYFDPKLKKSITGVFVAPVRAGYKKSTKKVLRVKDGEGLKGKTVEQIKEELKRRAQNKLREANKNGVNVSINNLKGNFDLWSGGIVTLSDFGAYSGRYLVTSIARSTGDNFSMSINLQRELGY